jgi:hypothetical protein
MRLLAKPTAFGCHSYAASLRGVNHRAVHQYPLCRGTTQVPAVFSLCAGLYQWPKPASSIPCVNEYTDARPPSNRLRERT